MQREAEGTHAVVEAMLHAVHHHFYREGERLPLPAAVFREMFGRIAEDRGVTLRWLAVEGVAMNVDHQPRDDFEREAVRVFLAGDDAFERVEEGSYRRAATIALTNQCLKCHVPDRKTLEDRSAGLVVTVPLREARNGEPGDVPANVRPATNRDPHCHRAPIEKAQAILRGRYAVAHRLVADDHRDQMRVTG